MASARPKRRRITTPDEVYDILQDSDSDMDEISDYDENDDESDSDESDSDEDIDDGGAGDRPVRAWLHINPTRDNYIPIWCTDYTRRAGPQFPPDIGNHPIDFFYLLFPDEAFELICDRTNSYAVEYFDGAWDLPPHSRFAEWKDTTVNEVKAFIGLQIMMGLCSKPKIADYWSLGNVDATPGYRDVMPRNRYQLLCSFLHFCNNEERIPRGQEGYDPLYKIAELINIVKRLPKQYYIPKRQLSIDETMRKYKGRIYFRQYIPNKPVRWGIKLWSLCESDTGYLLDWNIYTGKENNPLDEGQGLGYNVVMRLMRDDFVRCGHHLYTDNFYSSPDLFEGLKALNTGACGTVRINRKGLPANLRPKNLKLKKGDEPVFYR